MAQTSVASGHRDVTAAVGQGQPGQHAGGARIPDRGALPDEVRQEHQPVGPGRRGRGLGEELFGSRATEQFRDMQDAKLAESMAKSGSFGIAELLLAQFGGTEGKK